MTDYTVGDTIYKMFTTRAFASGIPTVLAGTPVVSAYENDSVTQITAGITLGVDHDGVVGMNLLTIVATGGNGFESGKDYNLVVTTGTVDSVSVVGEVVGSFSLGRSAAAVDLANGTDGLGALKALIDTIDDLLDTEIAAIVAAVITNAAGVDIAADIIAVKAETAAIVNDTDLIDDATSGLAKIATDVAAVLVDTANMQPKLGSPAADLAADVAAVKVETALIVADTNELQTDDIPALIAALNDLATSDVLAMAYEGSETFQTLLRLTRSVLVGKANGLATDTANYRDAADTKNRVVATVDTVGNRSAVTVDGT